MAATAEVAGVEVAGAATEVGEAAVTGEVAGADPSRVGSVRSAIFSK